MRVTVSLRMKQWWGKKLEGYLWCIKSAFSLHFVHLAQILLQDSRVSFHNVRILFAT